MRRAVVLAGWASVPAGFALKEYSLVAVRRTPAGGGIQGWQRLAEDLDLELSASWLLLRPGERVLPEGTRSAFRGYRTEVGDARLRQVLAGIDGTALRSRVLTDFSTAQDRCDRLRRAGRRLVFTNGVFDLFHVGHLRLLEAARGLGDALVVGINSDDSARRLKGRHRPAVPQFARAEIVSAIRGVTLCIIFPQEDPRELLRAVRPDVLAKGSEYRLSEVVGRELVKGWGGKVVRIPHIGGWSSTGLLRSLRLD